MNCPKCNASLEKYDYKGIDVDRCPECSGMWFDYDELDQLEDKEFADDDLKGSLIFSTQDTDLKCPYCGKPLHKFQYRLYNLHLEYCNDRHGFWLDAGEEKRVMEIMKQREKDMKRKFKSEAEWTKTLNRFRKRSFFDKLKDLFL